MSEVPAMAQILGADAPTNWGKWGPDDELGALNYLDAAEVLRGGAADQVRRGRSPCRSRWAAPRSR